MTNETTLKNLNTALQMELSAAHQYQLHAHVLDDWGLDKLADQMREEFEEETGHSNLFLERMFELGGEPEMAFATTPKVAKSLQDMFNMDLADEKEATEFYTKAAKAAYEAGDLKTKRLFETIAIDEVGHQNWLELQLSLIERIGEQNYASKYVSAGEAEEE
ncbi:bacterioferritin [Celeribacter halophilus]|jgi:bacterioferritin|uniref:bacterioferritin n=1 Tax=Celeribacter halophilus TaxID=576117 RepID=UPI001C0A0716|nr:bacterioferritin [Celeribacter halophilus]MBU2888910.1 bacterioferritin [Celeribacter halophilus]MDO6510561.1 bacterioferritin [Celeribacter halophilus]